NPLIITQQVSGRHDTSHPDKCARDIIDCKFADVHANDARYDGRKGTNDREKAGQDDGASTPLVVELLGLLQIGLLKDERVGPTGQIRAEPLARPISHKIT